VKSASRTFSRTGQPQRELLERFPRSPFLDNFRFATIRGVGNGRSGAASPEISCALFEEAQCSNKSFSWIAEAELRRRGWDVGRRPTGRRRGAGLPSNEVLRRKIEALLNKYSAGSIGTDLSQHDFHCRSLARCTLCRILRLNRKSLFCRTIPVHASPLCARYRPY
jgi:hypothetical protein